MTKEEKQDLRHAALYTLARRPTVALTAAQVISSLRRLLPFDVSVADATEALQFIAGLGHAEASPDPYGSEISYQITAAGILTYERDFPQTL